MDIKGVDSLERKRHQQRGMNRAFRLPSRAVVSSQEQEASMTTFCPFGARCGDYTL
ncbi:hypothetical protein [Aneurinibacillus migulanus]|uniref:hypothetical protein n=1 Tax=Aneurinibacillus migulanus TaxID=47500 RepID=UPI001F252121|nr:hypothetical protein [Aneurinibacillus migulanus]